MVDTLRSAPAPATARRGRADPPSVRGAITRVPAGVARRVLLDTALDAVRRADAARIRRDVPPDGGFRRPTGWQPPVGVALVDVHDRLARAAAALIAERPDLTDALRGAVDGTRSLLDPSADLRPAWRALRRLLDALAPLLDLAPDTVRTSQVEVSAADLLVALPAGATGPTGQDPTAYLAAVTAMHRRVRRDGRRPTAFQLVAEQVANRHLLGGVRGPEPYRTWGTSGFRDHQTYMSITDPGDGHLDGTLRDTRHLDGVIVHVEHLERGGDQDRERVEPYRMPHPHLVARVRLALGQDAPASSYVGRPVFEGDVDAGMLKAVHTTAAAVSALFAEGLAECKIAIEGMTATQAVRYMRALDAAVSRDRHRQVLSAAFNVNTTLVDDRRPPGGPVAARPARLATGLLGIELTAAGGFDKVTWDGTGDSYPSRCVLEQLPYADALLLVHRAHEVGLLTYFSAGFRFGHLPLAVHTGVDGVGVGGAQILRYLDPVSGHHGPFIPAHIGRVLATRNTAASDPRGRAAHLLSRLDRMRYELSITSAEDDHRRALFDALRVGDPPTAAFDAVRDVVRLPPDTGHPLIGWVGRLERAGGRCLAARLVTDWPARLRRLRAAATHDDLDHLADELADLRSRQR